MKSKVYPESTLPIKRFLLAAFFVSITFLTYGQVFTGINWVSWADEPDYANTPYSERETYTVYQAPGDWSGINDVQSFQETWEILGEEQNVEKFVLGYDNPLDLQNQKFGVQWKAIHDGNIMYVLLKYYDVDEFADPGTHAFEIMAQPKDIIRHEPTYREGVNMDDIAQRNMAYCRYVELGGGKAWYKDGSVIEYVATSGLTGKWDNNEYALQSFEDLEWGEGMMFWHEQDGQIMAVLPMDFDGVLSYPNDPEDLNGERTGLHIGQTIAFDVRSQAEKNEETIIYQWSGNHNNGYASNYYSGHVTISNEDLEGNSEYFLSLSAQGGGSVSQNEGYFGVGHEVTVTASPYEGYEFSGWKNQDNEIVSQQPSYTFEMPEFAYDLTAVFQEIPEGYANLSVTINTEEAGEVNGEGRYSSGDTVTVSASPGEGWRFEKWTRNGELVSYRAKIDVKVPDEDVAVKAHFLADPLSNLVFPYEPEDSEATHFLEDAYTALQLVFGHNFQQFFYPWEDRVLHEKTGLDQFNASEAMGGHTNLLNNLLRGVLYSTFAADSAEVIPDEALRLKIQAEARFIRAVCNHYLTTIYHDPPLNLDASMFFDYVSIGRVHDPGASSMFQATPVITHTSDPQDYYTSIREDLTFAINHLRDDKDSAYPWKPNKYTAMAMLGKVHLYNQNWQKAADNFQGVMDSGLFSLVQPQKEDSLDFVYAYLSNFSYVDLPTQTHSYKAEYNQESVFEIQYSDHSMKNGWLPGHRLIGWSGNLLTLYYGSSYSSYRTIEFHPDIFHIYETEGTPAGMIKDPRYYATVFTDNDPLDFRHYSPYEAKFFTSGMHTRELALRRGLIPETDKPYSTESFGVKKYYYPLYYEKNAPKNAPNNWRLIRYSDVLLMFAEASYHLGNNENARNAINQVRARVGMAPIDEVTPQAIIHERDVELAGECVRFHDLVRWSKLDEPWVDMEALYDGVFVKDEHEYLPFNISGDIQIKAYAEGEGYVKGGGFYFPGDTVQLSIHKINDEDSFIGWYENSNLLEDTKDTIVFKASESREIVAMFESSLTGEEITLADSDHPDLILFPNPARNRVTIKSREEIDVVSVMDIKGNMILNKRVNGRETSFRVQYLQPGIYLVNIKTNSGVYVRKLQVDQ